MEKWKGGKVKMGNGTWNTGKVEKSMCATVPLCRCSVSGEWKIEKHGNVEKWERESE